MVCELNLDGLAGPTHHYAGVAVGNVASEQSAGHTSNPRQAALQGLDKMRLLSQLGIPQAVMPPHARPDLSLARALGFSGTDKQVLGAIAQKSPPLLAACMAPSSMWVANSATVCPSTDSSDGKVHFTPANLQKMIHRSIEPPTTGRVLRAIFNDEKYFVHHAPLPCTAVISDEGSANHSRQAPTHGAKGIQLFVYGECAAEPWTPKPKIFPARQTREACEALVRLHQLDDSQTVIAQQNPEAIDTGVFHNDVISVGTLALFVYHEHSFCNTQAVVTELKEKYAKLHGQPLHAVEVKAADLSLTAAVSTYLFNSQLVALPTGKIALIAPSKCEEDARAQRVIAQWLASDVPIDAVHYVDLKQSMQGGGGPACLRLRVVLNDKERASVASGVMFNDALEKNLRDWITRHYRDRLAPADLADPELMQQSYAALDELTRLLRLPSIYPFQQ